MEPVTKQFGVQNWKYRLLRACAGSILAITALGHLPGWDGDAGAWVPPAEAAFEWIGILGVFVTGLITSEAKVLRP